MITRVLSVVRRAPVKVFRRLVTSLRVKKKKKSYNINILLCVSSSDAFIYNIYNSHTNGTRMYTVYTYTLYYDNIYSLATMTTTTVEPVNGSSVQDGQSTYTTSVFARYKVNLSGRTRGNNNKKNK